MLRGARWCLLARQYHHSRLLFSSRLEVRNDKGKDLAETADMNVSEILLSLETGLSKHSPAQAKQTLNLSAALRHLAWKVRPSDSDISVKKFTRRLTAASVGVPTVADLCTLQPFKLLLRHLYKQAPEMGVEQITDIVSATARRDFTVNLRTIDSSVGQQEVPLLRAVMKRALDLLGELPFRTLLRAMVVLSRDELGFEREGGFAALTQELIERTKEGPLGAVHWTLLSRSLQDMSDFFRRQDTAKLQPTILTLTKHLKQLLEQDNQATPANMILTIQALTLLEGAVPTDWREIKMRALGKAEASCPNTLMHLASLDRLCLLREDLAYPLIHRILHRAIPFACQWSTTEIVHVLSTLVQLGFRQENLLNRIAQRLISLVEQGRVDEPTVRIALLAYAKLNFRDEALCLALSSVWQRNPPKEERVLKIMSSLWALTVMNVYPRDVFEEGWRLCNAEAPFSLTKRLARRLAGFHLTLTKENPTWEFCRALPASMSKALLLLRWRDRKHPSSTFHLQVQGTISRLNTGAIIRNEAINQTSKRSVDITLFFPDGLRVAVECNGPTHYLRPSGYVGPSLSPWPFPAKEPLVSTYVPCGETLFKQRTLEAAGLTVIHVPWWEWYRANKTEESRRAYLQPKLHAFGIPTMTAPRDSTATIVAKFRMREAVLNERRQFVATVHELQALEGEITEVVGLLQAVSRKDTEEEGPGETEGTSDEDDGPMRCNSIRGPTLEEFQIAEEEAQEAVEAILSSQVLEGTRHYLAQFKGTAPSDAFWVRKEDLASLPGFKEARKRFRLGRPVVERTGAHSITYREPAGTLPSMEQLAATYFPGQRIPSKFKDTSKRKKKSKV